ncbi:hypothetical protein BGZ65_008497 [Modicella reniformis]|uniref:F-box domain-containing protein n=1 Tax=Modicella reniformis TaxID=1440133 RepID=A0A9P6M886_9FUNG|nr:hypothetical protein BGZ65_008497 [Modicella reniformis]
MTYDADSTGLMAPPLCLNADALEDLAPVQPTKENLLPASFPTLTWSEQSSAEHRASKSKKRLCYRHRPDLRVRRAADETQLEELRQGIDKLPSQDQQIISHIWSLFGSASAGHRQLVLSGLLTQCCIPQLSLLSNHLHPLLRIDFLSILSMEIAFHILSYLDATSLCHAAQVCKSWRRLADDDVVWHRMCEQHIGLKCTKCGWGLPLLEKKKARGRRHLDQQQQPSQSQDSQDESDPEAHSHIVRLVAPNVTEEVASSPSPPHYLSSSLSQDFSSRRRSASSEFGTGDRSPKRARYSSRSPSSGYEGSSSRPSPLFQQPEPPVKPTGAARRPWKDIYSERQIVERNWRRCNYKVKEFRGHTDGVMCLQFDDSFLITGSYDKTVKVWNIETGECLRTLTGHTLCIWNFATGECTTLTGHRDLVNKVQIYKKVLLFSASDDRTVKLWDIATRTCLRTFTGHADRVQCLQTSGDALIRILNKRRHNRSRTLESGQRSPADDSSSSDSETRTMMPIVVTGGLDNTLKIWNAETGDCLNTLFGHEDGVWSLAFDKLRIVSGSLDRMIKVWDTESGDYLYPLSGLDGAVTCVGLGDTRVVGGSANGSVLVWGYGVRK